MTKPFFYKIKYYMEDFKIYHGRPDPTSIDIAIEWIDHEYNPNAQRNVFPSEHRGEVFLLSNHRPTIRTLAHEFNIPFPTREWLNTKPNELNIHGYIFKIVDRWNGYEYVCEELKLP